MNKATMDVQQLRSDPSFADWQDEHLVSRTTSVTMIPARSIRYQSLPNEVTDNLHVPFDTEVSDLKLSVDQFSDQTDIKDALPRLIPWHLTGAFVLGGLNVHLSANQGGGELQIGHTASDEILSLRLGLEAVCKLVLALTLSEPEEPLHEEIAGTAATEIDDVTEILSSINDRLIPHPQILAGAMHLLGRRYGETQTNIVAHQIDDYGTRAILTDYHAEESPNGTKTKFDLYVATISIKDPDRSDLFAHRSEEQTTVFDMTAMQPLRQEAHVASSAEIGLEPSKLLNSARSNTRLPGTEIRLSERNLLPYGRISLLLMGNLDPHLQVHRANHQMQPLDEADDTLGYENFSPELDNAIDIGRGRIAEQDD